MAAVAGLAGINMAVERHPVGALSEQVPGLWVCMTQLRFEGIRILKINDRIATSEMPDA